MVVDGEGMTVYPGLVDALSTWGMPGAAGAARGRRSGRGYDAYGAAPCCSSGAGPEDRPSTTSWIKAADEIQPGDKRIESARNAGFTTAAVWPTRGFFAGQGSLVDLLSGEKVRRDGAGSFAGAIYFADARRRRWRHGRRLPERSDGHDRLRAADLSGRGPLSAGEGRRTRKIRGGCRGRNTIGRSKA